MDDFLAHFRMLAAVPRPSGHERDISNRLKAWAEALGSAVRQNAAWNLVFDVPATAGLEDLPLVALQAHIDMVCTAREGRVYDPLHDPIVPVVRRDSGRFGTLAADGTSLGADDGAGVALIMAVVKGKMTHGPLRVVFTADEEVGMGGALSLTSEDLRGVEYLLNIDSEASDTVTVSSAASAGLCVTDPAVPATPPKGVALEITLGGLSGGHSGLEIGLGRCNGIIALAEILEGLAGEVACGLASFAGGTADNAIPAKAVAVVVVDPSDRAKAEAYIAARGMKLGTRYGKTDPGLSLRARETTMPGVVLADGATARLLRYVAGSIDGVRTMSRALDGLVESSSNLGRLEAGPEGIRCTGMARSSDAGKLREIVAFQAALARECGLAFESGPGARAWPVNPDSALVPRLREIYRGLTGKGMRVAAVHAGLECGVFAELDGKIDMASIGPDISFAHSPDETLRLDSVPLVWRLLEGLLAHPVRR